MPTPSLFAAPADATRVVLRVAPRLIVHLHTILEGYDDLEVVATATDLPGLLAAAAEHDPDVVLTDIRMPPDFTDEGIRAAAQLRRSHPRTGVVALTQYSDVEYALDLVREGSQGRGYLLKERVGAVDELVEAVRTVAAGGSNHVEHPRNVSRRDHRSCLDGDHLPHCVNGVDIAADPMEVDVARHPCHVVGKRSFIGDAASLEVLLAVGRDVCVSVKSPPRSAPSCEDRRT